MICRQRHVYAVLPLLVLGWGTPGLVAEPFSAGLFADLIDEGVSIEGESFRLTPPQADPRLPQEELAAAQRKLAGSRGWTQFTRDSIVAPVHIALDYLKGADGQRIGLRVHFAFVVHADVQTLRDGDLMQDMFAAETDASQRDGFHAEPIDQQVLADQGFEIKDASSYGWLETVLLNKITLSGVIRSERLDANTFFRIVWVLDEQFTGSQSAQTRYRNEWSELDRDDLGNQIRSQPVPYQGTAGYLSVSPVHQIENASLIEAEVILHEPKDWFSGSNLLRSKVPLIIQESARKLRRGLK